MNKYILYVVLLFLSYLILIFPVSAQNKSLTHTTPSTDSTSSQQVMLRTSRLSLPALPAGRQVGNITVVVEQKEGVEHKSILISDYLSSTKVILNEEGEVVESPEYYPYGESINPTSPKVGNNRYYTNQRKVTEDSTLYNYNARYYNPDYSYFIQPDSVEGPARYSYVAGNPIMNNDPSGNVVCTFCKNSIDTSQYPEDPEDIPDVSTKIGVMLKRAGVFDTVSLAKQAFDTATGIGYRPEWDSTLSYSNSLNKYVSKDQALSDRFVNDGLGMVGAINVSSGHQTQQFLDKIRRKGVKVRNMTPDEVGETRKAVWLYHQKHGEALADADRALQLIRLNPNSPSNLRVLVHEHRHLQQPDLRGLPEPFLPLFRYIHEVDAEKAAELHLAEILNNMPTTDVNYGYYYRQYQFASQRHLHHLKRARGELDSLLGKGFSPSGIADSSGSHTSLLIRHLGFRVSEKRTGFFKTKRVWSISE